MSKKSVWDVVKEFDTENPEEEEELARFVSQNPETVPFLIAFAASLSREYLQDKFTKWWNDEPTSGSSSAASANISPFAGGSYSSKDFNPSNFGAMDTGIKSLFGALMNHGLTFGSNIFSEDAISTLLSGLRDVGTDIRSIIRQVGLSFPQGATEDEIWNSINNLAQTDREAFLRGLTYIVGNAVVDQGLGQGTRIRPDGSGGVIVDTYGEPIFAGLPLGGDALAPNDATRTGPDPLPPSGPPSPQPEPGEKDGDGTNTGKPDPDGGGPPPGTGIDVDPKPDPDDKTKPKDDPKPPIPDPRTDPEDKPRRKEEDNMENMYAKLDQNKEAELRPTFLIGGVENLISDADVLDAEAKEYEEFSYIPPNDENGNISNPLWILETEKKRVEFQQPLYTVPTNTPTLKFTEAEKENQKPLLMQNIYQLSDDMIDAYSNKGFTWTDNINRDGFQIGYYENQGNSHYPEDTLRFNPKTYKSMVF